MRQAVLALLKEGPKHGLLLKEEFSDEFGPAWPEVNAGQVYVTLQRLQRDGLVDAEEVPQEGKRSKTVYRITGAGLEELESWYREPSSAQRIRDDFVQKLVMAARSGSVDPMNLIDRQRAHYMQALADVEWAMLEGGAEKHRGGRFLLEGLALHLQADLKWLDICEEEFAGGKR
jgi:DNA-binding PadR family transcriptional regulator